MATYYWVGGSGTWDATTTTNWATSSGGAGGAGVPTSVDDVIFDANSNITTGSFTVTIAGTSAAPSACRDFSTGGAGGALDGAMTLAFSNATSVLAPYGSITLPATNLSVTGVAGSILRLLSATSATLTTNGVSLSQINNITINGGGTITLGSALTAANLNPAFGTLDTANYNVTLNQLITSGATAKSIILGSSSVACSASTPIDFTITTGLTFNAGTSTITCSSSSSAFNGGGQTFYNVTFSSSSNGTTTINGSNTFNNLTQTSRSASGIRQITLGSDQIVNGTLTLGASNTATRRILVFSSPTGTRRTITLNGTLATLADVDFRDIGAAGTVATPWTGTRLGNGLNNNNITFDSPKTVYWNLSGSQNWSATAWAATNNGVPAVNNFPLAQDTAVFTEAGAAGTVTIDANFFIGTIQMADGISNRTTAFTLATSASPTIYGNVTLFSNLTVSGTNTFSFSGQGITQTITSAGVSLPQTITINSPEGTVKLADNLTNTSTSALTLTAGALDINGNTLICVLFSSANSNARTIAFGAGNITVTGNATTVWSTDNSTNFTVTGTPTVNLTYSGSTGTRIFVHGSTGGTEANSISFNVSAGTDTVTTFGTGRQARSLSFIGFSGTFANNSVTIYGDLTFSSGMSLSAGTAVLSLRATSGTQQVTTAGKTLDFPITVNAPGATVAFQDALTQGSTRAFTFTEGTLQFKNGVTSTVGNFLTTGTTQKFLQSTLAGSQATLSEAAGTISATYTTIRDINATGGAEWNALIDRGSIDAGNNAGWNFTTAGVTNILNRVFYRQILQPVLRG